MAWTYFTAPLNPGDIITLDQRNELIDAVGERMLACLIASDGYTNTASYIAALKASPIETPLIVARLSTTQFTAPMQWMLFRISGAYMDSLSSGQTFTGGTSGTFFAAVAAAMGITTAQLTDLWGDGSYPVTYNRMPSAIFWNSIRAAIQLLAYPRTLANNTLATAADQTRRTRSGSGSSWAAARNAALAAAGTTVTSYDVAIVSASGHRTNSTSYTASLIDSTFDLQIPDAAPFTNGYLLYGLIYSYNFNSLYFDAGEQVHMSFDGDVATADWNPTSPGELETLAFASRTSVGSFPCTLALDSASSSAAFDLYEPTEDGQTKSTTSLALLVFSVPTFTHP